MTRRVWQLDSEGRPVRLVDVETFEDAVPVPPTWVCVTLAVVALAIAVWQGGVVL